jgi:hypothetical protein
MATKKISKKPALKLIQEMPQRPSRKSTPLSKFLEEMADIDTEMLIPEAPPRMITFELEKILTWPSHMQQTLFGLISLDTGWSKMERKRANWRLRYHKRKLAAGEKKAA